MDEGKRMKLNELRHKQSIFFTVQDVMFLIGYSTEIEEKLEKFEQMINKISKVQTYEVAKSEFQIGWNGALDAIARRINSKEEADN